MKTEGVTGKVAKTVTVKSNDPRQPEVQLTLSATVEPEFLLSERSLYFGTVPKGKEVVKELSVTIPADKSARVLGVQSTDQYVTARIEPVAGADGKKVKVVAVQKADTKEGYHFGNLVIKTTSAFTPEIKVPVRGMVTAPRGN